MTGDRFVLGSIANNLFGKINVRSVQNSQIWLLGVFLLFIVVSAIMNINIWVIFCLVLLLAVLTIQYIYRDNYFMRNHPEYLRSESYQLQKQQLEMMGSQSKELPAQDIEALPVIERPKDNKFLKKGGNK